VTLTWEQVAEETGLTMADVEALTAEWIHDDGYLDEAGRPTTATLELLREQARSPGAIADMARSGQLPADLADALSAVTSPFGRDVTGYEDVPTPELHARWRAGETADYVEEELRRRHPELARLWDMLHLVMRTEDEHRPPTDEPFDAMKILDLPYPISDETSAYYRTVRDALVQYDDSYLDGPALARRLGVEPGTVRKMTARGVLPKPDLPVAGRPAWHWLTVRSIESARRSPGRPSET
jgi:hypothetical protein